MALYTVKPTPLFEAREITSQEDADAWVTSLTENELVSGDKSFTNVRFEIRGNTVWLKYTVTSEVGSEDYALDTDLGGYAIANKDNTGINLWVEGVENFTRRYQPVAE
jgi:hypothetical protein